MISESRSEYTKSAFRALINTMRVLVFSLFIVFPAVFSGCYTFKGFSIAPEIETFYIGRFELLATNAPATLDQIFTESLKDKISRESRLSFSDTDADIEFQGSINSFTVTSVAPQPGETTAFNRLEISVQIDYINYLNEEQNWNSTFRHFEDFPSTVNLLSVQDELIDLIFDQIMEDIFNKAFTNW